MRAKSGRLACEDRGERLGAGLAPGAVGVGEEVERRLERAALAEDLEA